MSEPPSRLPTLLKRFAVGLFGSLFGFPSLWIVVSSITEPAGRDRLFPILLVPSMITLAWLSGGEQPQQSHQFAQWRGVLRGSGLAFCWMAYSVVWILAKWWGQVRSYSLWFSLLLDIGKIHPNEEPTDLELAREPLR